MIFYLFLLDSVHSLQGVWPFFHKNAPMMSNYSSWLNKHNTISSSFWPQYQTFVRVMAFLGIQFLVIVLGGSQSTYN